MLKSCLASPHGYFGDKTFGAGERQAAGRATEDVWMKWNSSYKCDWTGDCGLYISSSLVVDFLYSEDEVRIIIMPITWLGSNRYHHHLFDSTGNRTPDLRPAQ